jgi:hypothetical protein
MRLWIGIVTFVGGASLWFRSHRLGQAGARWLGRLGLGMAALGVSTMAMTLPGVPWTITSICFSIVAIALIGWVVADTLRRR